MRRTAPVALVVLLSVVTACHKDTKEAQLKALDEAYKSGVFTKEEYDAKRQSILGPPPAPPASPTPAAAAPAVPAPASAIDPAPPVSQPVASPPPVVPQTPKPVAAAPSKPVQTPRPQPPQQAPPVVSTPPPPVISPPQPAPPAPPAVQPAEPEPAPLAGCQDAESRAGGSNAVQERFFVASEDSVRQAALQAFANLDFTVHRSTDHEIEASKKRHLSVLIGAGGERVTLRFSNAKKNGQSGTKVTAETKKTFTGKLAQKSWTSAVLAQIVCNLRGR